MIGLVGDHLWQSTLVALVAALLTLVLRTNRAHARYGLWISASVKFLVPFAALLAIGSQLGWRTSAPGPRPEVAVVIDAVSQPFSQPDSRVEIPAARFADRAGVVARAVTITAVAIWLCGSALIVANWLIRWRRVGMTVRSGGAIDDDRVPALLRGIERTQGRLRPVDLVLSDTTVEPGVFGIVKPILLWPRSLSAHLSDQQIEAILAHELAHVRYRDNLFAAVHMLVQAAFWFHPLVWWIGRRLVDERERACDEAVIRAGSNPRLYAESILKTCQFSVQSPLVCVSGVTGSDLKKRIEQIMRSHGGDRLGVWKKVLLTAVGTATVAVPVIIGGLHAPKVHAQVQTVAGDPTFEVASVKPNKSGLPQVMLGMQPGGRFTATNAPLRMLIRNAYQLQDFQLVNLPDWATSERFDIVAKAEGDVPPAPIGTTGPLQLMVRSLLSERFKLVTHHESRDLQIYALVLAKNDGKLGAQLRPATVDCAAMMAARGRSGGPPPGPPPLGERPACGMRIGPGTMAGGGFPMSQLAQTLSQFVQRVVVDRTGLTGNYDLDLTWTPDQMPQGAPPPGAPPFPAVDPNGPSIFTALQEQLGLKLDAQRGPVDVLVVDSVERPTPD